MGGVYPGSDGLFRNVAIKFPSCVGFRDSREVVVFTSFWRMLHSKKGVKEKNLILQSNLGLKGMVYVEIRKMINHVC